MMPIAANAVVNLSDKLKLNPRATSAPVTRYSVPCSAPTATSTAAVNVTTITIENRSTNR
jgi:hypothetical protein